MTATEMIAMLRLERCGTGDEGRADLEAGMIYTMTTPCDQCPFLKSMAHGFTIRQLEAHASGEFGCHKACVITETEDGADEFTPTENTPHCGGLVEEMNLMTFKKHISEAEKWIGEAVRHHLSPGEMIALAAVHVSIAQAVAGREAMLGMKRMQAATMDMTAKTVGRLNDE